MALLATVRSDRLTLKRQLLGVAAVTAVAQFAAFIKLWLVARYFGVGTELDAYNLAFVVPTLLSGVIFAAVQTGLFPVYSTLRIRSGEPTADGLARAILGALLVLGLTISGMMFAGADAIAALLVRDGSDHLRQTTAFVLRFASFAVALNAVGDYLGSVLALRGRFLTAAAAPIANGLLGAVLLLAWPEGRLTNLALGTLLGIVLQSVIVMVALMATGFSLFGSVPQLRSVWTDAVETLRLGAWVLPGVVCSGLVMTLPSIWLVPFGDGAVSAFGYAFRFHQTAVQLIAMAVSPILLTRFSELVALGEIQALDRLRRTGLRISLGLGFAILIVVFVFGEPILLLLFGHGRFDVEAAGRVADHWIWLSAGLGAALYGIVLAKQMQAGRHAKQLSLIAALALLTFVIVALSLRPLIGEWSIPIAIVAATIVPTLLMHLFISEKNL